MTVEGENDDISGLGQTEATHELCSSIPDHRRVHYVQKGVGHYGVFNGSRFRSEIVPRIHDFMISAANPTRCRRSRPNKRDFARSRRIIGALSRESAPAVKP